MQNVISCANLLRHEVLKYNVVKKLSIAYKYNVQCSIQCGSITMTILTCCSVVSAAAPSLHGRMRGSFKAAMLIRSTGKPVNMLNASAKLPPANASYDPHSFAAAFSMRGPQRDRLARKNKTYINIHSFSRKLY